MMVTKINGFRKSFISIHSKYTYDQKARRKETKNPQLSSLWRDENNKSDSRFLGRSMGHCLYLSY